MVPTGTSATEIGKPATPTMEISIHHPFRSPQAKETYLSHYDRRARAWPVVSQNSLVETSYGQTFVRASGPLAGPPLVLLPGIAVNSLMWAPNIQALSELFRTYAVDNIYDCGRSINTRHLTSADDFVKWLDELFDGLGLGNGVNLMGMSYGGWLSSQYAQRFPNRLGRIVLIAPAATILPLRVELLIRLALGRWVHRHTVHWMFEDLARKDESGRRMVEDMLEDMRLASECFEPRGGVFPTVLTDREWREIEVPALFLVGGNEKIYSAQKAVRRLNRLAPQIETEIIPEAGHDLTFVQANRVNTKIIGFLK